MTPEQLQQILEQNDPNACIRFFSEATETERRALAETALASMPAEGLCIGMYHKSFAWQVRVIAVLASCSIAEMKQRGWHWLPDQDYVRAVLAARHPDWRDEFAVALSEDGWWELVRRLVREGLCREPRTEKYVIGMLQHFRHCSRQETRTLREELLSDPGLLDEAIWRLFEVAGDANYNLASHDRCAQPSRRWDQALLALSEKGRLSRRRLLDASLDALARDFAPHYAGWFSRFHDLLAPTDKERIKRADKYLALLSSRNATTVSWALKAVKRIERLRPIEGQTLIAALQPTLRATPKTAAVFALSLLAGLARRAPDLSPMVALTATEALDHADTEVQAAALRLLEHQRQRVHSLDANLLLVKTLAGYREHVAASLRGRLDSLAGLTAPPLETSPAETAFDWSKFEARSASLDPELAGWAGVPQALAAAREGRLDLTALEFDGTKIPRLDPATELRPITELDELIDVCAALLEGPLQMDDLERALDGISRLCGERPDDFATRIEPLRERARTILRRDVGPFAGWSVAGDLAGVVLSWTAEAFSRPRRGTSKRGEAVWQWTIGKHQFVYPWRRRQRVLGFLSRRSLALAERASRRDARPLLSTPTHSGGWIDPVVLVERTRAWLPHRGRAEHADRILALLRLAPDRRAEALHRAVDLTDTFGQALRYALGESRLHVGPSTALWVAAARARCPYGDDPLLEQHFSRLGPDAATAAKYDWHVERVTRTYHASTYGALTMNWDYFCWEKQPPVPQGLHPNLVTVQFHVSSHRGEPVGGPTADTTRWVATVWPIARESFFAGGIGAVLRRNSWESQAYLESLLDPDTPLRPVALVLLVLSLGAIQFDDGKLVSQILIAAIDDGRVDDLKLGEVMGRLLLTRLVRQKLWASTLGQVARTSPLHAHVVRSAIECALRGDPRRASQDLFALLELLRELVFEAGDGIHSETARAFLQQIRPATRAGKAARTLLNCEPADPAGRRAQIMPAVVEGRLQRAERWTRWTSHDAPPRG